MEYFVKKFELTSNPETILYSAMEDMKGRSLPAAFSEAPYVRVKSFYGGRKIKIVSKSTTSVTVRYSKSGRIGLSSYYANFKIIGEV